MRKDEELHKYVRKKFLEYLHYYQASQLDELKTYLENDGWAICPTKFPMNLNELDINSSCKCPFKTTSTEMEYGVHASNFQDASLESKMKKTVLENVEVSLKLHSFLFI